MIGCVALAQRYMKTTTLDEFAQSVVLFAKTIVVAEMFFMDMRLMFWYIIAYFSALYPTVLLAARCTRPLLCTACGARADVTRVRWLQSCSSPCRGPASAATAT